MSRLGRTLNKPIMVLVAGVVAVVLNVLLYYGLLVLWYRTPLIIHPEAGTQTSVDRNDVVWACGRKVLPGYQGIPREARNDYAEFRKDFAKGMRKDCGIYGPQATPRGD